MSSSEINDKSKISSNSLIDFVYSNNKIYLDEKKQKYDFDFSSNDFPAKLIILQDIERTEEEKISQKCNFVENNMNHKVFFKKRNLIKILKERIGKIN